jgi:hypothetical protein
MGLMVSLHGTLDEHLDDVSTIINLRTPISITLELHPVLGNAWGNMQAVVPLYARIAGNTGSFSTALQLYFASGKLARILSNLSPYIRMLTITTTKVTISIDTGKCSAVLRGKIDTVGRILTNTGSFSVYFQAIAPPQPRDIQGVIAGNTGTFYLPIVLQNKLTKLAIDLRMARIIPKITGTVLTYGTLSCGLGTLNSPEIYFQAATLGFKGVLTKTLDPTSGYLRGYVKVYGVLRSKLASFSTAFNFELPTHYVGSIDGRLGIEDRDFPVLRVSFLGVTIRNVYGTMSIQMATIPWYWIQWTGIVPWNTKVGLLPEMADVRVAMEGNVSVGGRMQFSTDIVRGEFISGDIYCQLTGTPGDLDVSTDIELMNVGSTEIRFIPVTSNIGFSFRGRVLVYGKLRQTLSDFRRSDFRGELASTGYIIGGDTYPDVSRENEFKALGIQWPLPEEKYNPWVRKYYTMQSAVAHFYGEIEIPIDRFGTLTMRSMGLSVYSGSTAGDAQLRMEIKLRFNLVQGRLDINPGKDDPALIVYSGKGGFRGMIDVIISGRLVSKLRGIQKSVITAFHYGASDSVFYRKMDPVDCRIYGIVALQGFVDLKNLTVSAEFISKTMDELYATANLRMEKLTPHIIADFPRYNYGLMWSVIGRTTCTFLGRISVHGSMTAYSAPCTSIILLGIKELRGTLITRTSSFRLDLYLERGMAWNFVGTMFKTLNGITPHIAGGIHPFVLMRLQMAPVIPHIYLNRVEEVRGMFSDNQLKNCTTNFRGIGSLTATLFGILDDCVASFEAKFIEPVDGTLESLLSDAIFAAIGHIPAYMTLDLHLEPVKLAAYTINGWFATVMGDTGNGLLAAIILKLYSESSALPPVLSVVIEGDVAYEYNRFTGAKIRIYDNDTEEYLKEKVLLSSEKSYNFADVSEGSYYVIGTADQSRVKSEIFDELEVTT